MKTELVTTGIIILLCLSGWIALLMHPKHGPDCTVRAIEPVEDVRVFQWNQLTQEKGKEITFDAENKDD